MTDSNMLAFIGNKKGVKACVSAQCFLKAFSLCSLWLFHSTCYNYRRVLVRFTQRVNMGYVEFESFNKISSVGNFSITVSPKI